MADFKATISYKQGVIAEEIGGLDLDACLEFYPGGATECAETHFAQMPVITRLVNTAAK